MYSPSGCSTLNTVMTGSTLSRHSVSALKWLHTSPLSNVSSSGPSSGHVTVSMLVSFHCWAWNLRSWIYHMMNILLSCSKPLPWQCRKWLLASVRVPGWCPVWAPCPGPWSAPPWGPGWGSPPSRPWWRGRRLRGWWTDPPTPRRRPDPGQSGSAGRGRERWGHWDQVLQNINTKYAFCTKRVFEYTKQFVLLVWIVQDKKMASQLFLKSFCRLENGV